MDPVVQELLKLTILGPILVALGWYTWRIYQDLQSVQKERFDEAKAIVDKLLKLNTEWNATISSAIGAADVRKEQIQQAREVVEDLRKIVIELRARIK